MQIKWVMVRKWGNKKIKYKISIPLSENPLQEFSAHKNKSFQGSSLIKLNDPRAHFPSNQHHRRLSWKTVKSSEVQRLLSMCV